MRVVVAIPTISERPGMAERTAAIWRMRTPGAIVTTLISTAGASWAAGLNDAAGQTWEGTDVFVCASDDMVPDDNSWLDAALPWLRDGLYPAPTVIDPRFTNYGGHPHPVTDGTPSDMSTFPILRGDWLPHVFPLPEDLHYYSDNLIAVKLQHTGVECVAVPSCRIIHEHAQPGRGCGFGNENTRLYVDSVRYSAELERLGIDRDGLTPGARGGLWEERYLQVGRALGA